VLLTARMVFLFFSEFYLGVMNSAPGFCNLWPFLSFWSIFFLAASPWFFSVSGFFSGLLFNFPFVCSGVGFPFFDSNLNPRLITLCSTSTFAMLRCDSLLIFFFLLICRRSSPCLFCEP